MNNSGEPVQGDTIMRAFNYETHGLTINGKFLTDTEAVRVTVNYKDKKISICLVDNEILDEYCPSYPFSYVPAHRLQPEAGGMLIFNVESGTGRMELRYVIAYPIQKTMTFLMIINIAASHQKASFVLHPKIYWGVASEIQEGQAISSAVLKSDNFFTQDIEGVNNSVVTLTGNPKAVYKFEVENID